MDRTLVKPQDLKIALAVVASNSEGQLLAWRHLKAHWHYMQSMFGNGTFTMGSMISAVTSHFATEYDHLEASNIQDSYSPFFPSNIPFNFFPVEGNYGTGFLICIKSFSVKNLAITFILFLS